MPLNAISPTSRTTLTYKQCTNIIQVYECQENWYITITNKRKCYEYRHFSVPHSQLACARLNIVQILPICSRFRDVFGAWHSLCHTSTWKNCKIDRHEANSTVISAVDSNGNLLWTITTFQTQWIHTGCPRDSNVIPKTSYVIPWIFQHCIL